MRKNRPLTSAEVGEMHRVRDKGRTPGEIGVRLGRPASTVRYALRMQPCDLDAPRQRYIHPQAALNERRAELKALREAMIMGEVTLADVLLGDQVHPLVVETPLIDVVLMGRAASRRRNAPGMEAFGREAVLEGVNLLLRAGRANEATRRWVVEHARCQPRQVAA